MKFRLSQAGFSAVEIIIGIVILTGLALGGHMIMKQDTRNKQTSSQSSSKVENITPAPEVNSNDDLDKASASLDANNPDDSDSDSAQLDAELKEF